MPFDPTRLSAGDLGPGSPARLGLHLVEGGANVAVFSAHAEAVELCLFDGRGREQARLALPERTGPIWHGHVPGLRAGQRYGLRAHGRWAPEAGHLFNPAKLLVDPYARLLTGEVKEHAALYPVQPPPRRRGTGAPVAPLPPAEMRPDPRDSARHVPKAVVTDPAKSPARAPGRPPRPRRPWSETVIYEAHVRGLTRLMPGLDPARAGTWEALAEPAVIAHLQHLGITAIELLPVQAMADEPFALKKALSNYWGYSTLAFLAPAPRYLGTKGEAGIVAAIDALHAAGIEVILDVVYNHTAEGGRGGRSLSFRGLDNASYYRLLPEDPSIPIDDTGCGNTMNLAHPQVLRLVMDSLRHWVGHYGIDGFRFDLASTLGRELHGFDRGSGFF
ncbi:MAG: alpha-amylase family glycosyl hydrolase, partial [Pseudomonadota bacterium]